MSARTVAIGRRGLRKPQADDSVAEPWPGNSDRDAMIVASGLHKTFRTTRKRAGFVGALRSLIAPQFTYNPAVAGVSFSAARGELLTLLGPNGAGKSTTIKMLTGILTPTAGHVLVAGIVPHKERQRNARNVGVVFGQRTQLWWDLPAYESFQILRDIYGLDHAAF